MNQMHARVVWGTAALVLLSMGAGAQSGKVDLTGKWLFAVETSAGTGTPTMTFTQDGEKLTGHYSGQLGEADLTGSVKGRDVSFTFTVDVQGNALRCTYTGTAENSGSIKGAIDIVGLANGTFTAKRQ